MKLDFYKYQGAGNDFILFDNRQGFFPVHNRSATIQRICERHFGVGSDGLMLIEKSDNHSFYLEFYNPDSTQSFCGNGSRCAVLFAFHMGWCSSSGTFDSKDGTHSFEVLDEQTVKLEMISIEKSTIEDVGNDTIINTGSPHYVIEVDDLDMDVIKHGREIRYNDRFAAAGINVNFVKTIDPQKNVIAIRTYERGVENETLACGTGITACALNYAIHNNILGQSIVFIKAKGGILSVSFDATDAAFDSVYLTGPAQFVYKGEINV
jgi:diaminopimelate epimerase